MLDNSTADRLFNYAGVIWRTQQGGEILVRSRFVKVEHATAMVIRYQEISKDGQAKYSAPLFFMTPRMDGYKLVVTDCESHLELNRMPLTGWQSERDKFLVMLLQDSILHAANVQDVCVMPAMPGVYFSLDGSFKYFWTAKTAAAASKEYGVPETELAEQHLQDYWNARSVRHGNYLLFPQSLFLGATKTQRLQAWLDLQPVLGCPVANPAWEVLTDMRALPRMPAEKRAGAAATLLQIWQSGIMEIAQERKLLPDTPSVVDIFELQSKFREDPMLAASIYADYLDMLQELHPQTDRGRMLQQIRDGILPDTFQQLQRMPPNIQDPRQPDARLQQAVNKIQSILGRIGRAVLDADAIQALARPSEAVIASQLPKPCPFRIYGLPSVEGLSWETESQRCDLFTGQNRAEYEPIAHRRRGGITCEPGK